MYFEVCTFDVVVACLALSLSHHHCCHCHIAFVRGDEPEKKELTPAEKKAQKALRAAADKKRKKKLNAPARILKIEVRYTVYGMVWYGMVWSLC